MGYTMSTAPRVPVSAANPLNPAADIQINHCRMPDCDNFGVPAKTTPVKTGRSSDRDLHYTLSNTSKGRVAALKCKCCGEKPPLKSNQGIAEELARISAHYRVLTGDAPRRTVKIMAKARRSIRACTTSAGRIRVTVARDTAVNPAAHAFKAAWNRPEFTRNTITWPQPSSVGW